MNPTKTLKILCTNIRSLSKNYSDLLLALQSLSKDNFDIIALTETWITEEQAKLHPLSGYKLFIQARTDGRRSGGVILYIRNEIIIVQNEKIKIPTADVIKMKIRKSNTYMQEEIDDTLTLILIYRDCKQLKTKFVKTLTPIIENNENNVLLLGDINIDILNIEDSADYLNTLESLGFKSIQNEPTRDSNCLDHVFFKSDKTTAVTKILDNQITDHSMIMVEVAINRNQKERNDKRIEIEILNEKKFIEYLKKVDWSFVNRIDRSNHKKSSSKEVLINNINTKFEKLFTLIQGCRQRATKIVKFKNRKNRQPWATKELIALAAEKSIAYKEHRADPQNIVLKKNFQELSKRVKRVKRKAITEHYDSLLNENLDNPKEYWNVINGIRGIKSQEISQVKINGNIVLTNCEPTRVAEEFNVYFNKVPEKLLSKNKFNLEEAMGDIDVNDLIPVHKNKKKSGYLETLQLTESDIEKAIMNLKNKKSVGHDGISAYVVKQLPKLFAKILTPLLNESLKQGIFPDILKIAEIVPVYKDGEKECIENYRPISLLSVFAKIFENCVYEKMNNYLEHTKFYAPQQFGFLKGKSTDTALYKHISQITESVENNKATVAVYLDLAKAFDTVNYKILIRKLINAGIRGPMINWLMSYLTNRKHRVKIKNTRSNDLTLKIGVPQGSVLGSFLFIVYINDLFSLPLQAGIIGYADDTSLLYSAATVDEIEVQFKQDVTLLTPWFRSNFLHLNINKCKKIIFAYKTPMWAKTLELKLCNEVIEGVNEYKYLGLILDEKLTWKNHSIYIQSKLRKINYLFYHLKKYLNSSHLKRLYSPLYESVFSYGIVHWGACKHIKPIKVLQNRVCRTILKLNVRTSESIIYPQMKVARLEELFKIRLAIFVFKNKLLFQLHDTELHTRTGSGTVAAHVAWRKEHSRMQAQYQGYMLFNALPLKCRQERKLSTFKRLVREFILK